MNQCDGCLRGLPLQSTGGFAYHTIGLRNTPHMACTAHLYEDTRSADNGPGAQDLINPPREVRIVVVYDTAEQQFCAWIDEAGISRYTRQAETAREARDACAEAYLQGEGGPPGAVRFRYVWPDRQKACFRYVGKDD